MKSKIKNIIQEWTKQEDYDLCQSIKISQELKVNRNQIAKIVNDLFESKDVIKINTRPIVFLDRKVLEDKYQIKLKDEYSSFEQLSNFIYSDETLHDFEKLIGSDESMNPIVEKVKATVSYPPDGLTILLYGPTGTGKSFMAKLTYEYCLNKGLIDKTAKFVQVNCSEYANNPELLTANLFGYKKGAFTGADKDNYGLLHYANGGILFLDEVHCLNSECQEKLFLYMDQGIYHLVGDNDKWYKAKCRIIFATTEDPEVSLLKTLRRRIPVILTIPSLSQRGVNEKLQLIYHLYKKEEKRIHKEILISTNVYQILLNHEFVGNIGELSNVIQASCVSALFNNNKDKLEIRVYDLPENVVKSLDVNHIVMQNHQVIPLATITPVNKKTHIIQLYEKFIILTGNDHFYNEARKELDDYFEKIIFNKKDISQKKYLLDTVNKVFDIATAHYGFHISHNELVAICSYLLEYNNNVHHIVNWTVQHENEIEQLQQFLKLKFHQEYIISTEIYGYLKDNVNNSFDSLVQCVIMICIAKYTKHDANDLTVAIILAHGYSTASSIADSANRLLDNYIFDAIDMPLEIDSIQIVKKINEFLSYLKEARRLYLLVDMGSLEEIYQGIEYKNIDIALINNVNTKLALTIGQGIVQKREIPEIFDDIKKEDQYNIHIELNHKKEPIILCSCASGMGTANKLKEIILESLPANVTLKVLTYDYASLIKQQVTDDALSSYKIICILGTLNPHIQDIPFIAIEDLILNDSHNVIEKVFKNYLSYEQMNLFEKNVLKNFSLSNVMNNLTILNPNKLLEHVSKGIEELQKRLHKRFKNQTCFGLYVHICCLVERLVTRQAITSFADIDFERNHQDFIHALKSAMKDVEKFYNVEIPVEEIEYIYEYVKNDG